MSTTTSSAPAATTAAPVASDACCCTPGADCKPTTAGQDCCKDCKTGCDCSHSDCNKKSKSWKKWLPAAAVAAAVAAVGVFVYLRRK